MVDARLPGHWFNEVWWDELSDAARTVFVNALMFSNNNGTDGFVPMRQVRRLHPSGEWLPAVYAELSGHTTPAKGLSVWTEYADGYRLNDWETTLGQTTHEQMNRYLEQQRERQALWRQRRKGARESRE